MKLRAFSLAVVALFAAGFALADDHEGHETIEKVMKEGMKGDSSYFGKVKAGTATAEDYTQLYELVRLLRGTEAPKGDQADYEEKVEALIHAAGATAYVEPNEASLEALKSAANCKACHNEHKPE